MTRKEEGTNLFWKLQLDFHGVDTLVLDIELHYLKFFPLSPDFLILFQIERYMDAKAYFQEGLKTVSIR